MQLSLFLNLLVVKVFYLHEIRDLYGDTTTSYSESTHLENIKAAANEELKIFHALCSCLDVKEDVDFLAWYERVKEEGAQNL
jgi:hypothetical protein